MPVPRTLVLPFDEAAALRGDDEPGADAARSGLARRIDQDRRYAVRSSADVEDGEGAGADARTDIYALGVVLFEMVTGRVPFEGDTPLSVAVKHKNVAPPDPATLNPLSSRTR